MNWTKDDSPPEDIALEKAWDKVNTALDKRVRLETQLRITACVADALSFVPMLRSLEVDEIRRCEDRNAALKEWERSDRRVAPKYEWDSRSSYQFAGAVKAMYYFVRSLQDATYAALLQLTRNQPGKGSSMADCIDNPDNPVHKIVSKALPDYLGWFGGFRDIRNEMKSGVGTSFGFRGPRMTRAQFEAGETLGLTEARIQLQVINEPERTVSFGRELSLADVTTALSHSAKLLEFVADFTGAHESLSNSVAH